MTHKNLVDSINAILKSSLSFAFYFYPGEADPEIVIQQYGETQKYKSITGLKDVQGFVIAPFTISDETPLIMIRPDIHVKGASAITALKVNLPIADSWASETKGLADDIGKDDYLRLLNKAIAQIKANSFEKIILSRTITTEIPGSFDIAQIVLDLKAKADNAFVYLISTPETGIWMGASPEILLSKKNKKYRTVSLAGTMPLNKTRNYTWSANHRREQEIVTEFIESQLITFKIHDFVRKGPFTEPASYVAHLKTTFEFSCENLNGQFSSFVDALHLSPAVCGKPKDKAKEFIIQNETHRREYYTGFLGAWNMEQKLQLFVNIRCLKLIGRKAVLFVGGGITAESVPEKEWEETNDKAKTLLSIISNRR
jgi:isochorismate synthase